MRPDICFDALYFRSRTERTYPWNRISSRREHSPWIVTICVGTFLISLSLSSIFEKAIKRRFTENGVATAILTWLVSNWLVALGEPILLRAISGGTNGSRHINDLHIDISPDDQAIRQEASNHPRGNEHNNPIVHIFCNTARHSLCLERPPRLALRGDGEFLGEGVRLVNRMPHGLDTVTFEATGAE